MVIILKYGEKKIENQNIFECLTVNSKIWILHRSLREEYTYTTEAISASGKYSMVAALPPPQILEGDLKISDQNNWGELSKKLNLRGDLKF